MADQKKTTTHLLGAEAQVSSDVDGAMDTTGSARVTQKYHRVAVRLGPFRFSVENEDMNTSSSFCCEGLCRRCFYRSGEAVLFSLLTGKTSD